jgi:flagellar biosynthesis protein FliP
VSLRQVVLFALLLAFYAVPAHAIDFPTITIGEGQGTTPGQVAETVEILFILTIIGLAPSILILMTCFTRILIVLGFLRRALGLQTMPPDQILVGITLFLTMFIMWPTFERIHQEAFVPYKNNEGTVEDFKGRAMKPIRDFMFKQTRKKDLQTMLDLSDVKDAKVEDDVPHHVLIPAFVTSELTRSFKIGFLIYLPFFLIDMVVAAILMSMGMMMLPPVMISLPFKILLFVLVDGWNLLIINLVAGFA